MNRFAQMVERDGVDSCWEWLGRKEKGGYGRWGGGLAHRVAWEQENGPIPGDLTVDHICRNRGCVNPGHLRLLPPRENFSDNGWRDRDACKYGHAYTEENTALRRRNGLVMRVCRACNRRRQRESSDRRKP